MRDYELCVIVPVVVTDAILTSSNVAETAGTTDPAAWNAATAYVAGNQVSRIGANQHAIYQRLVNGTTATVPESDTANWAYVGPTNRWKALDGVNETQTSNVNTIQYVFTPGQVADAMGIDNADAYSISAAIAGGKTLVKTMRTRRVRGWYDFLFAPRTYRRSALFVDLPPLSSNVITLTIDKTGSTAKCGTCVIGRKKILGRVKSEAASKLLNFSKRNTDEYGNTTVVKRGSAKTMNVQSLIDNDRIDDIEQFLTDNKDAALFFSVGGKRDAFTFLAFVNSFEIVVAYANNSLVNFEIQGLT